MGNARLSFRARGFTLIEILIVLAIIGILAGLVLRGLEGAGGREKKARARTTVTALHLGLEGYKADNGVLPGRDSPVDPSDPRSSAIAEVVAAVRAAGLVRVSEDDLGVLDDPNEDPRPATREEIDDPSIPKVLIDPWGRSYVARENESKEEKRPWMRNREFMDIYSLGPNGRDDTIEMTQDRENDDIGNW